MLTIFECENLIRDRYSDWYEKAQEKLKGQNLSRRGMAYRVCAEFVKAVERACAGHGVTKILDQTLIHHLQVSCALREYSRNN